MAPQRILVSIAEPVNLLSVLLLLFFFRRMSWSAILIWCHVLLMLVCNSYASYLTDRKENNYFILHYMTFIDTIIVGLFYGLIIPMKASVKKIFWLFFLLVPLFCLVDSYLISSIKSANIYSVTLSGIFKLILITTYMGYRIQHMGEEAQNKRELALADAFSAGLLLYTASSVLFFLFLDTMVEKNILKFFLVVNAGFYLLSAVIFFLGILRYIWSIRKEA